MKFGICNEIFRDWPVTDGIQFAATTGYDAIEVAPFTLAKYVTQIPADQRKELREAAAKAGIEVSAIHWVLVQADGMHMTDPDPVVRERTSAYFCDLVDFCADLAARRIVVGSPNQRSLQPDVEREQGWSWATEVFRESIRRAEDAEVTICLEPLAPTETNFINTAAEAIRFVDQFDSPHFKIILDVKAMSSEAKTIPEIIRESWPKFAYFHANDRNLKGPGFGDVDFRPIADALRAVGYDGFVSVEVFDFSDGPEDIARKSLSYLKECFG